MRRLDIDPKKIQPVPADELRRFREAVRQYVVEPFQQRRVRRLQLIEDARKQVIS